MLGDMPFLQPVLADITWGFDVEQSEETVAGNSS
jgi:hypothetical protein